MIRSIFATTVALIVLAAASTTAQTTGGMTLDALGAQLGSLYECSLAGNGDALTLSHRTTGNELVTLSSTPNGIITMSAVVGQATTLSDDHRATLSSTLLNLNTRLPIGTLAIEKNGAVTLRHHVGIRHASITELTTIVVSLINAAESHRFELLG